MTKGSVLHFAIADLDNLCIDHIASYLRFDCLYRWVCAYRGCSVQSLSPEWFFRRTLASPTELVDLPLNEDAQERFYLAADLSQMRKCHFIPKFCFTNSSMGVRSLARWLDVDPNSVYVERIAMLLGRLLSMSQTHARLRRSNVTLWDVICAARMFGFSSIPDHDQVFMFESSFGNHYSFQTAEECCSMGSADTEESLSFYMQSIESIRSRMQTFVEDELMVDQNEFTTLHAAQYIFDTPSTLPMDCDDSDIVDIEAWLMDQSVTTDPEISPVEADHQLEALQFEFNQLIENLWRFHNDLNSYELIDFGIDERRLSKSRPSKLSLDGLIKYLEEVRMPCHQVVSYSAAKFIQLLIEDIHYGSVVEVKVQKPDLLGITWDYGFLFGENGTSWRCLVVSDLEETLSAFSDDEDDDYNLCNDDLPME